MQDFPLVFANTNQDLNILCKHLLELEVALFFFFFFVNKYMYIYKLVTITLFQVKAAQLAIEACPNTWLRKTLNSVQL